MKQRFVTEGSHPLGWDLTVMWTELAEVIRIVSARKASKIERKNDEEL